AQHPIRTPSEEPEMNAAKSATDDTKNNDGFSAEERAAMKERAAELRAEARRDEGTGGGVEGGGASRREGCQSARKGGRGGSRQNRRDARCRAFHCRAAARDRDRECSRAP